MWLADTNFPWEKKFEVEDVQLLTMIFSENFLSVEIFLEWKLAFRQTIKKILDNPGQTSFVHLVKIAKSSISDCHMEGRLAPSLSFIVISIHYSVH
jgi:hypothetical protein